MNGKPMARARTLHGKSARKNTNEMIFKRCGLDIMLAFKTRNIHDKDLIKFLEESAIEPCKVVEAVRLINERTQKLKAIKDKKNAAT